MTEHPRHGCSRLRFWPRSLLWRTFLLVAILMLLSVAAWFSIFSLYEREPRAKQLAQTLVSVANLTRVSLLSARPEARMSLLRELSDREGIHIYPAEPGERIDPLPPNPTLKLVHAHLREQLGPTTRLTLRREDEDALFVTFRLDDSDDGEDSEFWVALPRERLDRVFPISWMGWGIAALSLSLLGAWLIVFRVTQPLKAIKLAARKVGAGETPPVLNESGPDEVVAVAKAFNQMNADLARLDQDRALILAGISHDLRTPLTRLRMGIELAADPSMRDGMSADVEEMDKTITQFLDFARSASGGDGSTEIEQSLDLQTLLVELSEQYRRRNLPVQVNTAATSPPAPTLARVRPQTIRRAITNLIDNALRYAPGQTPEISCRREGAWLYIEVRDHGPGIPAADIDRVKRPFTRLEVARSNVVGAGLGLAIVERIIRGHGGELTLLPASPNGLIARISLPAS
jgi:two-component system osmolarity sensor histidine kinase EnvZ